MGRLGEKFRRFPHTCKIYSFADVSPFYEGEPSCLWCGICRKELTSSSHGGESVIKSDYRVQLGKIEHGKEVGAIVPGIVAGMFIKVQDLQGTHELIIKDAYAGQLGTSVFCDLVRN